MTEADKTLSKVYEDLKISSQNEAGKYAQINQIVDRLQSLNSQSTINTKTTGTISERLCELALRTAVPDIYSTLGRDWKWIGDFSILGNPFNLIVSVKSFKAKERLMASGTGNVLSPTVGWGLFDDITEWTPPRAKGYLFRAFIAIYIPENLFRSLPGDSARLQNVNAKPFLRSIDNFIVDLRDALNNNKIDIKKI